VFLYISYHETEENNFHIDKIGRFGTFIMHVIQIKNPLTKKKKKQGNLAIDALTIWEMSCPFSMKITHVD